MIWKSIVKTIKRKNVLFHIYMHYQKQKRNKNKHSYHRKTRASRRVDGYYDFENMFKISQRVRDV